MKRLLLAILLVGMPFFALGQVVPAAGLQVIRSSRDLKTTDGDALGFNIPANWLVQVKSGAVFELLAGATLKADAGSTVIGITANAGGSNGQLQFNSNGALSGTPGLTWNGTNLTGLGLPLLAADAASKSYVDSISAGIIPRTAVVVASTVNLTLSGTQTIDGHATLVGERVLVKNQTLTQNNGIYDCAAGAWSRSSDSNTALTLKFGYYYFVSTGTTQAGTGWTITTAPVVLGTDPVVFGQFSASTSYVAGSGLTLAGNSFSVNAAQPGVTSLGTQTTFAVSGNSNLGTTNQNGAQVIDLGTASGSLPAAVQPASTVMRMANLDATLSLFEGISWGNAGAAVGFVARTVGGTRAAPLPTPSGYQFFRVNVYGHDGAYTSTSNGAYFISAASTWTAGNHETKHSWTGTPNGSPNAVSWMTLDGTGGLTTAATIKLNAGSQVKVPYEIVTSPVAQYDSASGGLYFGYGAGTSIIRSVADNAGTYSSISVEAGNGVQVGLFTNLGFQGDVGQTTPKLGTFTTINWLDNASIRATKNNGHLLINVKDYGAVGDGATNDTSAINSAIGAMTNFSTLYFPKGSFLVTPGSITEFSSLNHITVMGDGRSSQITSVTTGSPGNFLVFHSTCDHVTIRDLSIVGAATVRGSGVGVRMYASYALCSNLYIFGTSDFGFFVSNDASTYTVSVTVANCVSDRTLGDGFHWSSVTDSTMANCQAYYTGDDGAGIGDDGAVGRPATRLEVVNFQSMQAGNKAGGGTHGAGIRIFDGALDIHIVGGAIYQSCEAGLATGRFTSTTSFNSRITVNGLKVYQCLQQAGMYANLNFQWTNSLSVKDCWSEAPVSQGCYSFLDCNNVTVTGNTAKDAVLRAFVTDDGTTTNVAATCSNWTFMGNVCLGTPSNESYYFVAPTGKTITNLLITGNTETGQSNANYINTNRLAGVCKINNNTSLGGKAITNGASGVIPTTANNN